MPDLPGAHAARSGPVELALYDQYRASCETEGAASDTAIDTLRRLHDLGWNDMIVVPDDAGDWAAGLKRILRRVPDGWDRRIWCGPGWYPILVSLDEALANLDAGYTVHQVKEKFGGLRYYCAAGAGGAVVAEMDRLVTNAERASRLTCELTGRPGILMVRGGSWYKTFEPASAPAGYETAPPGVINGIWPPPP